ncbi:MAG: undecaprenyl-phosphate glucose phosphotransferase [Mucilaginibacter sp.]|uniref:undecaprenyl-phosphate glucose phosphotransferase n=1 Tax=Mucilaginibacter sp. TaxID=1882438 RepID=UPI0032643B36
MVHRYATFFKAINLTVDYLVLNVSMVAAYLILDDSLIVWINNKQYLPVVLVFNLIWLLSANITGLYEQVLNKDSIKTYRSVFQTYLLFVCLICVTILIVIGTKAYFITREYLFYSIILFGTMLAFWKLIFLTIRRSDRAMLNDSRKVIIVGAGRAGNELRTYFRNNPFRGYDLLGFFDDEQSRVSEKHLYLGNTDYCMEYVLNNKVDEIYCALPYSEHDIIERLMIDADRNLIRFKIVPEYHEYIKKPTYLQSFGNIPIISIRSEPLENMLNRGVKRGFDILFSLFVIVFIFSWLYPILSIIIKLESQGPILFVQLRSGRDNNPFYCYKFRSMSVNSNSDKVQATRTDARITRVGRFLRKTSIDELPQFFNVLIGNMSIVGPRPHMISHTEQYSQLIDRFMVRHFLKPGITGWAQVNGLRGETKTIDAMLERVEADVWYLENWSFILDIKIIILTFWLSIKGDKQAF